MPEGIKHFNLHASVNYSSNKVMDFQPKSTAPDFHSCIFHKPTQYRPVVHDHITCFLKYYFNMNFVYNYFCIISMLQRKCKRLFRCTFFLYLFCSNIAVMVKKNLFYRRKKFLKGKNINNLFFSCNMFFFRQTTKTCKVC